MTTQARRSSHDQRESTAVRKRRSSGLREMDARLRFALEAGRLGWWEVELPSRALQCSDICKQNFGRHSEDAFTLQDLLDSIHPQDARRVHRAIERSLSDHGDYDIECRIVWPDGQVHWVMMRGTVSTAEDEAPMRIVGVSLDITDRKETEAALAAQADQLLHADKQKDEFLATLAHELRNPLAPIRTGLTILKRTRDGGATERTMEMMDRQLGHMVRLIDDLMDLSRITRGKVKLRTERVTLRSVLEAALESSRSLLEQARQHLEVSIPEETVLFDVDPTRMVQVVDNLLNNAIKYTPEGGHIVLRARVEGDDVVIEVKDDGVGIPSEQLGAVFEMFSQVDRTLERSQGGLGIGLALVRKLLEMHGGIITARSEGPGLGSTFTITLPAARRLEKVGPMQSEPATPNPPKRILVVDDNRDAAECLSMLLEISGHSTQMAHTGPDAIATACTFHPEIVFLDIGLPGMDGYEVARQLRRDPETSASTLIAVTGWGSEEDRRRSSEAGFDFHLTKPVESSTVETLLARAGAH